MFKNIYNILFSKINKIINSNDITERIIKGSIWNIFGGVVSKFIGLIAGVLVARILGAEDFGGYGIILSTIGVFGMFSSAGMGLTATKYVAKYHSRKKSLEVGEIQGLTIIVTLLISAIFSFLMFISSELVCVYVLGNEKLILPIKIVSISLIFTSINGALLGIISGLEKFKELTRINIIYGVISSPLIFLLTYYWGLDGTVIGYTIGMAIYSLVYLFELRKINKTLNYRLVFNHQIIIKYKKILVGYSFPAIFGGSLMGPMIWISNIIFLRSENAYTELGYFQAGDQLKLLVIFFPRLLSNILIPILAGTYDRSAYKKVLKVNMALNMSIGAFFSLLLVVFSPFLMGLYGNGFEDHYFVLIFMALTSLAMTYNSVIGKSIASSGNMWYGFLFNSLWGLVLIIATWIIAFYELGAEGLAFSYFIAYLCHSIWQTKYLKNKKII